MRIGGLEVGDPGALAFVDANGDPRQQIVSERKTHLTSPGTAVADKYAVDQIAHCVDEPVGVTRPVGQRYRSQAAEHQVEGRGRGTLLPAAGRLRIPRRARQGILEALGGILVGVGRRISMGRGGRAAG